MRVGRPDRCDTEEQPLKRLWLALVILAWGFGGRCDAQTLPKDRKHLLVIGEEKGYRHDAVSHAMATIERLGRETGLWTTTIRTDTEALTKKKLESTPRT